MNLRTLYIICFIIICLGKLNAQTRYAKIVVYRNENVYEKVEEKYKIFADGNQTASLKNYNFEEFYMPEGKFVLKVNEIYATVSKVECSLGHTYYFRINRNYSLPDKAITIVAVDSLAANNELKYLRSFTPIKHSTVNLDTQNGIGIMFEPGYGFDKMGLLSTTTGAAVMHSFGGGVSFGMSYSYKFNNYFGLSTELSKQFTFLTPSLTNASVSFNQNVFSATPYFTIPVLRNNHQQIKVGGGLDYHYNPVLNFETDKLVNGFNDKWTYESVFGFHLIAFYEAMMGPNLRGHVGMKYNNVNYSFINGEQYQPLNPDLKTPNGNALSASLGIEYCF